MQASYERFAEVMGKLNGHITVDGVNALTVPDLRILCSGYGARHMSRARKSDLTRYMMHFAEDTMTAETLTAETLTAETAETMEDTMTAETLTPETVTPIQRETAKAARNMHIFGCFDVVDTYRHVLNNLHVIDALEDSQVRRNGAATATALVLYRGNPSNNVKVAVWPLEGVTSTHADIAVLDGETAETCYVVKNNVGDALTKGRATRLIDGSVVRVDNHGFIRHKTATYETVARKSRLFGEVVETVAAERRAQGVSLDGETYTLTVLQGEKHITA